MKDREGRSSLSLHRTSIYDYRALSIIIHLEMLDFSFEIKHYMCKFGLIADKN